MQNNHTWAVVLAAGSGKRLSALTADEKGRHVPKQFCSLQGGPSLLGLALERARRLVPEDRVCAVVAQEHETWWQSKPYQLHPGNMFVQPRNRGTGNGVLLALAYILKRDPLARLVFLPADHHVLAEDTLVHTMSSMLAKLPPRSSDIVLFGIEPESADPELGYIIPQRAGHQNAQGVRHFVEKPSRGVASKLIQDGGLWNSGIFAACGIRLLELLERRFPDNTESVAHAVTKVGDPANPPWALSHAYDRISEVDFSHHVLQLHVADLQVVPVPQCGWSDLGTPQRVAERMQLLSGNAFARRERPRETETFFDLGDAVLRTAKGENLAEAAMMG